MGLLYRKWVEYFLISFGKFKVLDKIGCADALGGRVGAPFPFFFFLSFPGWAVIDVNLFLFFRRFGPMMTEHTASLLELYLGV